MSEEPKASSTPSTVRLSLKPERLPHPLSREQSQSILTLSAYLDKKREWEGPAHHRLLRDWLGTGHVLQDDLSAWLLERYPSGSAHRKQLDQARAQAQRWMEKGIWVAAPPSDPSGRSREQCLHRSGALTQAKSAPADGSTPDAHLTACPQVFFGWGPTQHYDRTIAWIAVFNSRKSKTVLPHDEWLKALRSLLARSTPFDTGYACSTGTLTYDMVTAHAQRAKAPHFLVTSTAVEKIPGSEEFPFDRNKLPTFFPHLIFTCRTGAIRCSKPTRMLCRDHMLARFADIHALVEIRSGGNLLKVLKAFQLRWPRSLWIYKSKEPSAHNAGNFTLLDRFPLWAEAFEINDPVPAEAEDFQGPEPFAGGRDLPNPRRNPNSIPWQSYLYHYTRSCTAPWPGQSYRDYLTALLEGARLSGHTALDTLIRMLMEGLIRGSSKLVRGDQPVVSWTSRSPLELESIRHWNPALIRWTFEPFGIAVKRKEMKMRGVKPTVYIGEVNYPRLKHSERFRFQRHEPPQCSWKHEREWRLPTDLLLSEIPAHQAFVFVAERKDREKLACVAERLPFDVVTLSEMGGVAD